MTCSMLELLSEKAEKAIAYKSKSDGTVDFVDISTVDGTVVNGYNTVA